MAPTSPPAIIVEGLVYFTNLNDTPSRPDDTHDEIDLELDLDLNEDHEVAPNEMEEEKPKRESMYVELFQDMLDTVQNGEAYLFSQSELDFFAKFKSLEYPARYLLVRLALRKADKWHRLADLKYERELGDQRNISHVIDMLCHVGQSHRTAHPSNTRASTARPPVRQGAEGQLRPSARTLTNHEQTSTMSSMRIRSVARSEARRLNLSSKASKPPPEIIDLTFSDDDGGGGPNDAIPVPQSTLQHAIKVEPTDGSEAAVKLEPVLSDMPPPAIPSPIAKHAQPVLAKDEDIFWFIARDDSDMSIEDLLGAVSLDELKGIARSFKLKATGSRRDALVRAIINTCCKQSGIQAESPGKGKARLQLILSTGNHNFLSLDRPEEQLRSMLLSMLGRCVQLNPLLFKLFRRVNIVYLRSTQVTTTLMTPAILTRAKKRVYPPYKYERTKNIWASREELLAYEKELEREAYIEELFGSGGSSSAPARGRSAKSETPARRLLRESVTPARSTTRSAPVTPVTSNSVHGEKESALKVEEVADDALPVEQLDEQAPESASVVQAQEIRRVFESVFEEWKELVRTKTEDVSRPGGLQRFERGHVLTRVICKYTQALAILKEYDYERTVLDELLAQTRWRRGRRSRWHERRACLLMTHGEQNRDAWQLALQAVEAGINDEDTHVVYRPKLERRLTRLEKKLEYPKDEVHICEGALLKEEKVYIIGERVRRSSVVLDSTGRNINQVSATQTTLLDFQLTCSQVVREAAVTVTEESWTGKSIWVGNDGEHVNVETLALQHYETLGFKGTHCEGRIVSMLYGLLFWDIIFAPVPGAFETPFQSAPLDIAEDTFYHARRELIDDRLREIQEETGRAREIVADIDAEHREKGTWCVGVRWDAFGREDILDIVDCLGGKALAIICRPFVEDYANRAAGVPDLFLWNAEAQTCKFVEVKGPNDKLSEKQKTWIDVLVRAGVPVDVCHVQDQAEEECKKGKGKSRAKAKVKRESTVRLAVKKELIEPEDDAEVAQQIVPESQDISPAPKTKRPSDEETSPDRPAKRRA